jgi:peptide/nickel transport system ATP-binding protein
MAILLITHNLGVVAQVCDRVAVMYMGRVVETAATGDLLARPLHPYTRGLLASVPVLGRARRGLLDPIPGAVPGPGDVVMGCPFHPRCADTIPGRCDRGAPPEPTPAGGGRSARCHLVADGRATGEAA